MKNKSYPVGTKITQTLLLQIVKVVEYGYIAVDHTQWVKIIKDEGTTKISLLPKTFYILNGYRFSNGNIYVNDNTNVGR